MTIKVGEHFIWTCPDYLLHLREHKEHNKALVTVFNVMGPEVNHLFYVKASDGWMTYVYKTELEETK